MLLAEKGSPEVHIGDRSRPEADRSRGVLTFSAFRRIDVATAVEPLVDNNRTFP
jgi:hypothetical protein